ncbi:hypothetical protein BKA61DRAFT_691562 [Leptodontidium sp. MPI-SDFR-AT-0119]|nr:hypothetical protein BKA61DRAFT_691562 [Leptodontidium sp. MPI-SDFR-AT-0119]
MSAILGASPPPTGVVPNFQHPGDVLRTVGLVTNGLALGLTTLVTLGRLVLYLIMGPLYGGGGLHAWEIPASSMVEFQKIQYAAAIIYGPCIWSIKVTLLLILVRVFTPFRRIISAVWAFIFAMLLYYIIVTALKVFKCRPISSVWDPNTPGKCLNEILLFSIDTSLSIITDLIILILPIPLVWSLQVTTKVKLRTIALLGAGGLATSTGIVRLVLILHLDHSPYQLSDQSVSIQRINLLVTAEISIGIICACLPAFNIFFATESEQRSSRSRSRYVDKSMKLSNLSVLSRSKATSIAPDGRDGMIRESYVEISTPQDLGELLSPPEGAARRDNWPLRISMRQESSFELRDGGGV